MSYPASVHFDAFVLRCRRHSPALVFDPLEDEHLEKELEQSMEAMGPLNYLAWLCRQSGLAIDLSALNDEDARRTVRKCIRLSPDRKDRLFLH